MRLSVWKLGMGFMVLVCAFAWTAPALARTVHLPAGSVGGFNGPLGVAADATTHDVYVVEAGGNRVRKFNSTLTTQLCEISTGVPNPEEPVVEPLSKPTEIAVDNSEGSPSHGDVYIIETGHGVVEKYDSNCVHIDTLTGVGTPGGSFQSGQALQRSLTSVAVDTQGGLWIGLEKSPIQGFDSEAQNKYVKEIKTGFGGEAGGLGVDKNGNFYVNTGSGEYAKTDPDGRTEEKLFAGDDEARRVAVDSDHEEVYLDSGVSIDAFRTDGVAEESCVEPAKLNNCFGSESLSSSAGVAVDESNGTVYATDFLTGQVFIFEAVTLPEVEIAPVSEQHTRSLTLNGFVNPEGKAATCRFEYDTTPYREEGEIAHGTSVPCVPASVGSGSAPVSVSAHLEGLSPQTAYYYRLIAESGVGKSVTSGQEAFTGPLLEADWVGEVTSESATIQARIDANGGDTHYYVEYGTTTAYGLYAPLSPPAVDIGSAVGAQTLSAHLQGLMAGTTYDYRVVAVQDGESFGCDQGGEVARECDSSFITRGFPAGAGLFDGRSWELVSPPNKNGALIAVTEQGGQVQAAADGSGIAYMSQGPNLGEGPVGHGTYSQTLSRRGGEGWGSLDLTLPGRLPEKEESATGLSTFQSEYHLFSPDLDRAVVEPFVGSPPLSPHATERTTYLRDDETGEFTPLVDPGNVPAGTAVEPKGGALDEVESEEWRIHFLAATPDLRHIVFKTPAALTPEAIEEEYPTRACGQPSAGSQCFEPKFVQWNIYEWSEGELRLVNILPGNGGVAHGRRSNVRLAGVVNTNGSGHGGAQRAMSDDGRFVAWTVGEPYTAEELANYHGLYLRDMVEESTVRVGGAHAVFQTMNGSGSKVFYLEDGDLHMYEPESGTTTDLTAGHGSVEPSGEVQEVVSDVSEDGAYVYFVAKGVLAAGGVKGEDNLYLLHDTSGGWTTTWIAALAGSDKPSWYAREDFGVPFLSDISSRVSPDGRFLAFMSERPLTGYDNVDALNGHRDEEVFLYDAHEGRLTCASCNPTGERPVGVLDTQAAELVIDREGVWTAKESTPENPRSDHWLAGSIPGWDNLTTNSPTYQSRYLSNSGRLFFDSPDSLVPQATDGLENVYEYEPSGVGACTTLAASFSARSGGCVSLMSAGTSSAESAFYDASESGDDVFFATTSKLVSRDFDKGYDVYDAHVCTAAVPCPAEPERRLPCASGDACKPAPSPQPELFGPPPSATFSGAGNVTVSAASAKVTQPSRALRLARALHACRRDRSRKRRTACQRAARKRYGSNGSQSQGRSNSKKGGRGR